MRKKQTTKPLAVAAPAAEVDSAETDLAARRLRRQRHGGLADGRLDRRHGADAFGVGDLRLEVVVHPGEPPDGVEQAAQVEQGRGQCADLEPAGEHLQRSGRILSERPFPIRESNLTAPFGRRGTVPRTSLLRRLEASRTVPMVAVVAPPGYGKTTLLAQWAERDSRPFAWLFVDGRDNDPVVLLTDIAVAFDRHAPVDNAVFRALASPGASIEQTVRLRLESALRSRELPGVVVLDDAHLLQNPECLDAVVALAEHLPGASQIVVVGRAQPPLPVARLRAEGRVVEIGPDDLAMDQQEARSLLQRVEVDASEADVAELTHRTEGWPVALYLAALSLRMRSSATRGGVAQGADERFVADYLRSVFLSGLSEEQIRFLTRTAVLDRLCGPLCNAVLESSGSGELLESLERSNLLLVPLDRNRWWYRYHHLFQQLLRAELEHREPGLASELCRRAARWCDRNGLPEAAIEYGMRAGDAGQAARLVLNVAFLVYHDGRATTLQRWLDWFDDNGLTDRYPGVAVLGAWVHLLAGHSTAAECWAGAAARGSLEEPLPDGSTSLDGWLATLGAAMCRDGVGRMGKDAEIALDWLPVASPWRATAILLLAISRQVAGDVHGADVLLAHAVEVAEDAGTAETASIALAVRATLAMGREDWDLTEALAERASSIVHDAALDDYVSSTLLYAVRVLLAIHRGDVAEARDDLERAQRLRPRLTHAVPFYAVQTRMELIRAQIALMDVRGARDVLREVNDLLRQRPDLAMFREQADQLGARLDTIRMDVGASPLTAAELRLLPHLATHYSFREIGEGLHLSQHTVKTQAIAIYRKFGVSSRSHTIQRAQDLGLLIR